MTVLRPVLACGLLGFFLVGCGQPTAKVSGTVTINGKAVVLGTVNLINNETRPYQGEIHADGTFEIANVPFGKYGVLIFSPDPSPPVAAKPKKKETPESQAARKEREELHGRWIPIPQKYSVLEESGLSVNVDQSRVVHDFTLTD